MRNLLSAQFNKLKIKKVLSGLLSFFENSEPNKQN